MTATSLATSASRPERPSHLRRNLLVALVLALLVWALFATDLQLQKLLGLPAALGGIFADMLFFPDLSYLPTAWEGMVQSIQMAWVGTIIGAVLSLPLGFLGAKNVSGGIASVVIRQVLNAIRAFPELILAVVLIPPLGLGAVTGTIALGIHSTGTLGKLTAEVIEGIDSGPIEAARATGASHLQVLRWGVLPQVLPEIVAFWIYRFEINIRASAILGVVGAGGIGQSLVNTVNYLEFAKAGMALVVIVVTVIAIDLASGRLRRRIIEGGDKPTRGQMLDQPEMATELNPHDRAHLEDQGSVLWP
jgi:phosphonate transport system permease protein